jgi:hypothetical protein
MSPCPDYERHEIIICSRRADNVPLIHVLDSPRIRFGEPLYALASRKRVIIGPRVLVGGTAQSPDLIELVKVRVSRKDRFPCKHLSENTPTLHVSAHVGEGYPKSRTLSPIYQSPPHIASRPIAIQVDDTTSSQRSLYTGVCGSSCLLPRMDQTFAQVQSPLSSMNHRWR